MALSIHPVSKEELISSNNISYSKGNISPKTENHYVTQLYKYETPQFPKPGDRVFWYWNIGALSGSAGFILIRDGYVHNSIVVVRS